MALFVQDGPVGFRIVGRNPQALDWLVVQNSNAYEEGFSGPGTGSAAPYGRTGRRRPKSRWRRS